MKTTLTKSQQVALKLALSGTNLFITGAAGTGKSFLLSQIVEKHPQKVTLLASTGIAACHIGGVTLHSALRLPPATFVDPEDYLPHIKVQTVRKLSVLVLDEVSMVPAELIDGLEFAFRVIRENDQPWGGVQVIALGDFFQLPPIYPRNMLDRFAFQAQAWSTLTPVVLKEIMRQKGDQEFIDVLSSIRIGQLSKSPKKLQLLESRVCEPGDQLFLASRNCDVDNINAREYAKLAGNSKTFHAEDRGMKKELKGCLIPEVLQCKRGMRVMNLVNDRKEGLSNGDIGLISDFSDDGLPIVNWEGKGRTEMKPKLKEIFFGTETVPVYLNEDTGKFVDEDGAQYDNHDGTGHVTRPKVVASRLQIPIRQANAITIHKSQGLTFSAAYVKTNNFFVKGHPYVALSRVTNMAGLGLDRVPRDLVDGRVMRYMREIANETEEAVA